MTGFSADRIDIQTSISYKSNESNRDLDTTNAKHIKGDDR